MELQAILAYQEEDKKLYALERELAGCPERKDYIKNFSKPRRTSWTLSTRRRRS